MPTSDLRRHPRALPKGSAVVAYCLGPYCVYADDAVRELTKKGYNARRLIDGFPDWKRAGFRVRDGPNEATMTDDSNSQVAKLGLVLDCADPERLAEFWSAAIGYTNLGGAGSYVMLVDASGQQPKLLLQRVTEPKTGKNRMHLDIETPDIEAEAARLLSLGATRVSEGTISEHGTTWILMADPEANEFCICDAGQPGHE